MQDLTLATDQLPSSRSELSQLLQQQEEGVARVLSDATLTDLERVGEGLLAELHTEAASSEASADFRCVDLTWSHKCNTCTWLC